MVCSVVLAVSSNAFAVDDEAQYRAQCEDEVAGYGIEDTDELQQALEDCIRSRMGYGMDSIEGADPSMEPSMDSSKGQGNE